jgi:hypothetical protein
LHASINNKARLSKTVKKLQRLAPPLLPHV